MKRKIKRVCTVSPVDPPGKFDKNLRHFNRGQWRLESVEGGVDITNPDAETMFVPMSNIASIDYE